MTLDLETQALINKLNKKYGDQAVILGTDLPPIPKFTTGSLALDAMLGGGWPGNQWSELVANYSDGKTAVVLKTIAANQKLNPNFTTLWIAAEHFNDEWAEKCGCNLAQFVIVRTQQMEFAYDTVLQFAEERAVDCVVIDSYPALSANQEINKSMDEFTISAGARVNAKFFRKAGAVTLRGENERPILPIFINQWREKIGVMYGDPRTIPGGKAKDYVMYTLVELKRDEWIEEARHGQGKVRVGQVIKARTIKNKQAPPQRTATVDFYFDDTDDFHAGEYDFAKDIIDTAKLYGVLQQNGPYYSFVDKKWKGQDAVLEEVRQDLDLQDAMYKEVLRASE